jgi:hypothetical protein
MDTEKLARMQNAVRIGMLLPALQHVAQFSEMRIRESY